MALVSGISLDPEAAIGVTKRSPPQWVDGVDEVSERIAPGVLFACLLSLGSDMASSVYRMGQFGSRYSCVLRHAHMLNLFIDIPHNRVRVCLSV